MGATRQDGIVNKRLSQTARDMILSMGVLALVIGFVFLFTYESPGDTTRDIDYSSTLEVVRETGAFPVAVPATLATDWQATSVRYRPLPRNPDKATWTIGFLTPDDNYVAVYQTNTDDPNFLRTATAEGSRDGESVIDGVTWDRYFSDQSRHYSLVGTVDGVTTVVTGTLGYGYLATVVQDLSTTSSAGRG